MKCALLYMISWGAGSPCMIGWGVGPCYVILRKDGFLQMSGWNRWPMIGFLMINHCAEIQREPVYDHVDWPQWCPTGLTRSQKRRVQRLGQTELLEEKREEVLKEKRVKSQVWRVKPRADDWQDPGSSAAPINMVLMLPPIQTVGSANSY